MRIFEQVIRLFTIFFIFPLVFFWIGYTQIYPLFEGEFTQHLGSIEVSYIQMAKFIEASLPQFAWQPRWYLGYPMTIIYTPLVPFFEYVSHVVLGWSFGHSYRVLTAASYVGGLVTLYFFARTLFKNSVAGFISALWYGILPSIMTLLYTEVAQDRFAHILEPRRFTILVRWGEGPHIVSLFFLPLAGLFWIQFLRKGNRLSLFFGAIFTAVVALTNTVGLWGLLLLVVALTVGEIVEGSDWRKTAMRTIVVGICAYGGAAFWFNPLFVLSFFKEGGGAMSYWRDQFPWGWLVLLAGFTIYFLIARKLLSRFKGVTAGIFYFLLMFGLVNTYYASGSERLELVPQVLRLNTEVDLGSSLVASAIVSIIGYFLAKKKQLFYVVGMGVIVVTALVLVIPRQKILVEELPPHARSAEAVGKDLTQTAEYEVAIKLEEKITDGERAFVPGNYAFYLNYFTDVPQLRGALFQSAVHPWAEHIYYQLVTGKDAEIALAWLKISNIGWLILNGPRNVYADFEVGVEKFEAILEQVEESQGDRFYKVPLKNTSLAKAVPSAIASIKKPFNAIDKEPILAYVTQLEASNNQLVVEELHNGSYHIEGTVDEGEIILVQTTFVPGWKARDGQGKRLEVKKDPLGFILIKPRQAGKQEITLRFRIPWQVWIGWLVTLATLGLFIYIFLKVKKPLLRPTHVKQEPKKREEEY